MIFSEHDRKILKQIWDERNVVQTKITLVPAPDLRPLLNELGQQLGRVEAKQQTFEESFVSKMTNLDGELATLNFDIVTTISGKLLVLAERLGAIEKAIHQRGDHVDFVMRQHLPAIQKHMARAVRNGAKGRGKRK